MRQARSQLQMIFQDAISSLNPRRQIREVVAEPLVIRWLESFQRSPVDPRSGSATCRCMLRLWRHPIDPQASPCRSSVAFFVGLIALGASSTAARHGAAPTASATAASAADRRQRADDRAR